MKLRSLSCSAVHWDESWMALSLQALIKSLGIIMKSMLILALGATLSFLWVNVNAEQSVDPPLIITERMYADRFDMLPTELFPRIEFTGDSLLYFDGIGLVRSISARVYDESGQLIPDAELAWQSDSTALALTQIAPSTVEVESMSTWSESIPITAEYAPLGISATATAAMATLASDQVHLIPSHWVKSVLGDRLKQHSITLHRNATSETFDVGDIVVSGNFAGVQVRIVEVLGMTDDTVSLEVEPALITEAFESLHVSSSSEPLEVTVIATSQGSTIQIRSLRDDVVLHSRHLPDLRLNDLLECSGNLSYGNNFSYNEGLKITQSLSLYSSLVLDGFSVWLFETGMKGEWGVSGDASVRLGLNASVSGQCVTAIPDIRLPGSWAGPVNIVPVIGASAQMDIEASAGLATEWMPFGKLDRRWQFNSGLRYTSADGWGTFREHQATNDSVAPSFSVDGNFEAKTNARGQVDIGLSFCIGWCRIFPQLVDVFFIRGGGGPNWEFAFETPLSPASPDYEGPSQMAAVDAFADVGLDATLFGSGLLSYIPLSISASFWHSIYSEQFVLHQTPSIDGAISCDPSCDDVPNDGDGVVETGITATPPATGTASFWSRKAGQDTLMEFAQAPLSGGSAMASYSIPPGMDTGKHEVYVRLDLDGAMNWFTGLLPVAHDEPIGTFSVVDKCAELEVEVVDEDFLDCLPDPALRTCVEEVLGTPLDEVSELECPSMGIVSLAGLERFEELRFLTMGGNQIADLTPLSGLTKLVSLRVDGNQISDLSPLSSLTGLTSIRIQHNQVSNLSPLAGMADLNVLWMSGNQVSDISPLGNTAALWSFEADDNQIVDVSPLSNHTSMWSLRLSNNQITNVDGLINMTELGRLYLMDNQISDITALGGMSDLRRLHLSGNNISDLGPIAGLIGIEHLRLNNNAISNIEPLIDLMNLDLLILMDNDISDISPLAGLTSLTQLNLMGNQISDFTPLLGLNELWNLVLGDNLITNVDSLGSMTNLDRLWLNDNRIGSVDALTDLTNLSFLNLTDNIFDGVFTISCSSLQSVIQGLGEDVVNYSGCRCNCPCGSFNNYDPSVSCSVICASQCPD